MKRLAVILGTRSDVIKLAPVIWRTSKHAQLEVVILSTGQHREMLAQALTCFGIIPDLDISAMRQGQPLTELASRMLPGLGQAIRESRPELVMVHGDTATAFCGAVAAFYEGIPVAHVEAGLRSGSLNSPFPEEAHRRFISMVAGLNFCSTDENRTNLLREGISKDKVFVTGNTVIDSLKWALTQSGCPGHLSRDRTYRVLVTVHRRENQGAKLRDIASAVRRIVDRGDVEVVLPLHRNPAVRSVLFDTLKETPGILMCESLPYPEFVCLLDSCDLVLTDSGGLQEEAACLGKPVLVLNETTERPEAIVQGLTWIVGTEPDNVCAAAERILDAATTREPGASGMSDIFGDGHAAKRIVDLLVTELGSVGNC